MDRYTTNIAKAQIGFFDFIIKPSYQLLLKVCPKLEFLLDEMERNKRDWTELFDEYEEKMKEGNYYMTTEIEESKLPGSEVFNKRKTISGRANLPKLA